MANFNKAFNFRGGFQVDTDVLIVRGQNVGIGSTIPTERLDVNGIIKANGLDISSSESVNLAEAQAGILTVTEYLNVGVETTNPGAFEYPFGRPQVQITTGIITSANPALGVVTYYGDGAQLLNLPTSQWLDIDVGLGFTSIYAQGYVGVDTTDPRYVFQVGGVPFAPKAGFNTTQDGVGIEDGAIYATGIITTASDVGVGGTVSAVGRIITLNEFVGVGSNITILNADNIAIGSIGSMRYGDVINTKEVYADRFIGTATSAEDLVPEAQISIDTIRANSITAVSRFISTEGKIAIGHNDLASNVGDIDVRKDGGADSTIYSLSDTGSARIFAGSQRQFGTNNLFGGFRYGGNVPSSPLSGEDDLDIVNYGVGNINNILHDGSAGGGTTGAFRWINGQIDFVTMELSPSGKLSLIGNLVSSEPTLDVVGLTTITGNTFVDGDLTVTGASTVQGDLRVDGELSFGSVSITDPIQLPSAVFDDQLIVGIDPTIGSGVKLESNGNITLTGTIDSDGNTFGPLGVNITSGVLNVPTATIPTINTTDINGSGSITAQTFGNGIFTVDAAGELNAANVTTTDLTVTGNLSIGNVNIPSADFSTFTATNATITNAGITSCIIDELTVNSTAQFFVPITATAGSIDSLEVTSIQSSTGTVNMNSDVQFNNNVTGTNAEFIGDVQGSILIADQEVETATLAISADNKITFVVDENNNRITINVSDGSGTFIGSTNLVYS